MDLDVVGTTPKTAGSLHVPISSLLFQLLQLFGVAGGSDKQSSGLLQGISYEQGFLPAYRLLVTLIHKIPELNPVEALIFPKEMLYRRQKGFG